MEQWKVVPGYPDYEVSDQGRVRSPRGLLSPCLDTRGYPYTALRGRRVQVHKLVLWAFVGPRPPGLQARHLNDIKTDNRLVNLRWGTASENVYDKVRNGNHPLASKTHCVRDHEFTPENTRITKANRRICRACERERSRERVRT